MPSCTHPEFHIGWAKTGDRPLTGGRASLTPFRTAPDLSQVGRIQ